MKLESLKLEKFEGDALKKEQMFSLNGGGTVTPGGHNPNGTTSGHPTSYDYGYDSIREGGVVTYHNRTNVQRLELEP